MNNPVRNQLIVWRRNLLLCWFSLALVSVVAVGCAEETSIRKYRVAKSETHRAGGGPAMGMNASPAKEQLMLGAIVPNQQSAWFFKLTGDPDVVLKSDPDFRKIVKSVAFDGTGQPAWKLSEGWQQQITPNGITYGKLTNSEAGLTATVTRLPVENNPTEESWRDYVFENVNRWRKQLSLQTQEWEQMSSELEEFPELSQGPAKAYFVSIAGKGSGGMSAPFMNQGNRGAATEGTKPLDSPASSKATLETSESTTANAKGESEPSSPQAAESTAAEQKKPVTYIVPEGWNETAASGMRMAAFSIVDGESTGEVTVIAAGGGIEANIGIWLGQVGAEASAENDAKNSRSRRRTDRQWRGEPSCIRSTVPFPGHPETRPSAAKTAPQAADSAPTQSILIVDIPWRDGQSLFVKFKGDAVVGTVAARGVYRVRQID